MSKYELQKQAFQASGVSYEESLIAQQKLQPSIYERLGTDGLKELSQRFYNRVFDDKEATWFLNIFASSSKAEAIENQVRTVTLSPTSKRISLISLIARPSFLSFIIYKYRFLVQTFGGPDLYR